MSRKVLGFLFAQRLSALIPYTRDDILSYVISGNIMHTRIKEIRMHRHDEDGAPPFGDCWLFEYLSRHT
jgi:hypothetical protein